ncbi:hypothetical protein ACOSQ4_003289 [Xanthoceras sorbifolium]
MPSYLLFAISVWHIWKWRCSRIFDADFQVSLGPNIPIFNYALVWWKADIKDSISLLSWTPPPIGWLKVNVDGSAANDIISAWGVIRDHESNWVRGFSMNIGGGSILEAELWGILEGLKMVSTFGPINFVLLLDSADAIGLVNGKSMPPTPYSILFKSARSCWTTTPYALPLTVFGRQMVLLMALPNLVMCWIEALLLLRSLLPLSSIFFKMIVLVLL